MPLAVFELLKELGLRLVVEVSILGVLHVFVPDGRVDDLCLRLHRLAHTLVDRQRDNFVLRLLLATLQLVRLLCFLGGGILVVA